VRLYSRQVYQSHHVTVWEMYLETALDWEEDRAHETARSIESTEQIYTRVFQAMKPRTPVPRITIRFRKYANANSRISLHQERLVVDISDFLEQAPVAVHEALAFILISKLFRRNPDRSTVARYRRYLNSSEVRKALQRLRQERGRKVVLDPVGKVYDLQQIFEDLNFRYFGGLMARPQLGWSVRASRTTLGHYDPSHHTIVLTNLLDSTQAPELIVRYVMFHEMLHLRYPAQHRGVRRCVHTREFKTAEKTFENFKEAERELRKFVENSFRSAG
jgi:SprT-like family